MQVILTRKSNKQAVLEIFEDDNEAKEPGLIFERQITRYNEKDQAFLISNCGLDQKEAVGILRRLFDTQPEGDEEIVSELEASRLSVHFVRSLQLGATPSPQDSDGGFPSESSHLNIYVRSINAPRSTAQQYCDPIASEALKQAFNFTRDGVEPVLEWNDTRSLCVLDVDYHDKPLEERPTVEAIEDIVRRVEPKPFCWHPSHAGGAKLYYVYSPGYSAEELASIAAFSWSNIDCSATFDFGKSSRHPGFPREVDKRPAPCPPEKIKYLYGKADISPIKRMLSSELTFEEVQTVLEDKGWTIGQYLDHSQCPITPSDTGRNNVYIGEHGVYCHSCNARGIGPNPKRPGFLSYAHFVRRVDNRVSSMCRHFCHFEHASVVLSALYPQLPPKTLKGIYRVMMKIMHSPDDPRISLAMQRGEGYVRSNGAWTTTDGLSAISQNLVQFVRNLPAVMVPNEEGFGINVSRFTAMVNTGDLEEHGYPNIDFLRGAKVYGQFLPTRGTDIQKCVIHKSLRSSPPQYLPKTKRQPLREYAAIFEEEFPGLELDYLRLLIAAKGVSEGSLSQCPFLLINGPSGSGKSTAVHIAAGICGDKAEEPIFLPDIMRFRASLMDSARETSFIVINEIFKLAKDYRLNPIQALNSMLALTPDSRSHVLYVGSVPFGRLPAFVLTDIDTPGDVLSDVQIARRFVTYSLQRKNAWEDTFTQRGIRAHEFRLISHTHALTCDSILSDVIDEFFTTPMSLKTIAQSLGGERMGESSEVADIRLDTLRILYKLICEAPPVSGSDAVRYRPEYGWKVITKGDQTELARVWQELLIDPENWGESRIASSTDWSELLGIELPERSDGKRRGIKLVCNAYQRNRVYVRFMNGDAKKVPNWVNGRIIKPFEA